MMGWQMSDEELSKLKPYDQVIIHRDSGERLVHWRTYRPNFRLYIFMHIMVKTVVLKPRIADARDS
jgi:hypothetical protein